MHPAEIQAALKIRGINQSEIARYAGVSRNTVSSVVNGRSRSQQIEQRISELLGIPVEDLWPHWYGSRLLHGVTGLTQEERELVERYRRLVPAIREKRRLAALDALDGRQSAGSVTVTASGDAVAGGRDVTIGTVQGAGKSSRRK